MKKLALLLIALPFLSGCGHRMRTWTGFLKPHALMTISVGMTKEDIIYQIGTPDICRGSFINNYDQVIELWEYMVLRHEFGAPAYKEVYWLFFHDNKLVKWCKAGDWETTQHEIKEIRFR